MVRISTRPMCKMRHISTLRDLCLMTMIRLQTSLWTSLIRCYTKTNDQLAISTSWKPSTMMRSSKLVITTTQLRWLKYRPRSIRQACQACLLPDLKQRTQSRRRMLKISVLTQHSKTNPIQKKLGSKVYHISLIQALAICQA